MEQDVIISANKDASELLWLGFKAGNPDALGKLAQIHYKALYNYGSKFSSDSDFVRDCIQELYLELWERRTFLSETAFVKSYLLKALRHKLIKESVRLKRFQEPQHFFPLPGSFEHSIESEIIDNEEVEWMSKKLNRTIVTLTRRQQEIIYLRFYQSLEYDEISHIMGLNKQSVANLLYRTIKEIKTILLPSEFFWLLLLPAFS